MNNYIKGGENMLILEISEEQQKYLSSLLDRELRLEGINALVKVVDIFNTLASAKVKEESVSDEQKTKIS